MTVDPLGTESNYASLSTKDLLEARDQYHWHLINKKNVIATAVGLYHIRTDDDWPSEKDPDEADSGPAKPKNPRTFDNSEVRPYSWPCVLVLVDEWVNLDRFGTNPGQVPLEEIVPRTLYMPDGRTVPVCVMLVTPSAPSMPILPAQTWPDSLIGGGFPLTSEAQGEVNIASIGCLVTDGHLVYALTSRHVVGEKGHPIHTKLAGKDVPIGVSSKLQLTRLPFSDVYQDFPGRRTFLTLDAGLIEIKNLKDWTSKVFGLPPVGEIADLNERNIGMRLINAEVVAYGATSGYLRGRIAALFFRHRSIGGYDDVTDFLISPTTGQPDSHPGDSGTVWHLVQKDDLSLRPIALQWGGQSFLKSSEGAGYNFALASGLSNILRLLNVELVVDYNTKAQPYWGKTGHYSVASFACQKVSTPALARLMVANQDSISFPLEELRKAAIDKALKGATANGTFVPLADVPDLVWKNLSQHTQADGDVSGAIGGRDTAWRTGPEHPNHFADMDEPNHQGKTLRELSTDAKNVTVDAWKAFYTDTGHTEPHDRGLLPFRVWQFFDVMVDALTHGKVDEFVCAAGLMAHYVGDASQPLHSSSIFNGFVDANGKIVKGEGVHSEFESDMIDKYSVQIVAGMTSHLAAAAPIKKVTTGKGAAKAIVDLMARSAEKITPTQLVNKYATLTDVVPKPKPKVIAAGMWRAFGESTIQLLTDSSLVLSMLWESAWTVGTGSKIPPEAIGPISQERLKELYQNPSFAPSRYLDDISPLLK